MRGESFFIGCEHRKIAARITAILLSGLRKKHKKYVITVAGETGSGKSGIAHEIARLMNEKGLVTLFVQQDDYFFTPPKTNYARRRKDISIVGLKEVNLGLINEHISQFKDPGTRKIKKPLVIFDKNKIIEETVFCGTARVLIIEGTYVSLLENVDKKIFLSMTYRDTFGARMKRARERIDKMDEKILRKEHRIVSGHRELNDIVVEKDHSITRL